MIKKIFCVVAFCSFMFFIGCASGKDLMAPDPIPALSNATYSIDDFNKDYDEYKEYLTEPLQIELATMQRDIMINRIRVVIEGNYRVYETELFGKRALFDTTGDIFELGLSTASTISTVNNVKTILSAILTGVKGSRLSIDKNFFREKTTEIIVSKMRASRDYTKNEIIKKMSHFDAKGYNFEEAWVDLLEFYYAGTLQGGIQALANEAASDAAKASKETKQTTVDRIELTKFTSDERENIREIRKKFNDLYGEKNYTEAKRVLKELGYSVEAETDVFIALDEQIKKIPGDRSLVKKLMRALKIEK